MWALMQGNQGGFATGAQSSYVGANQGFSSGSSFTSGWFFKVVFVAVYMDKKFILFHMVTDGYNVKLSQRS
jgi:hypothetical protein